MRIVVVDDAAALRRSLVRFAAAAGHEVVGETALVADAPALVARLAPDAVVIDGRLPPDGGVPLIARLKADYPELWIVVVAALSERKLVAAAVAAGASAALLRPIVPSRVAAAFDLRTRRP